MHDPTVGRIGGEPTPPVEPVDRGPAIAAQETAIGTRLLDYLGSRNDVRIIVRRRPGPERAPTISFEADGRDSAATVGAVDPHGLGIRFGDFHPRRLVERLVVALGEALR